MYNGLINVCINNPKVTFATVVCGILTLATVTYRRGSTCIWSSCWLCICFVIVRSICSQSALKCARLYGDKRMNGQRGCVAFVHSEQ